MTKTRRVLQWLAAGNDLMSPTMARSMGLDPAERTSMIKYLRLKKYVEATGPMQYRVTDRGIACMLHVHKTDERVLALQRASYRRRQEQDDQPENVVAYARFHVPNSVFAMGAMA
jgi:hypothetical protein